MNYKIRRFIDFIKHDIPAGFRNLRIYFPIIWKMRDWDGIYLMELMSFHIKRQAKGIGGRNIHTDAKRDSERMNTVARLLDKIQTEYYHNEYYNYEDERELIWHPIPGSDSSSLEIKEPESEHLIDYFKKYKGYFKRNKLDWNNLKTYRDKQKMCYEIGQYNHNKAKKLCFKILEEQIECWWD